MQLLALIGGFGLPEMLVVLAILALIFGARKLPELGRGLGEGIKNFRGAVKSIDSDASSSDDSKGSGKDSNESSSK